MLWQEQNARRMQILVVDDSVHIHHQLRTYFSSAGYENVSYALSAAEAFEQIAYNDRRVANSVDLILMDIDMDGISGIEAVQRIKSDPRFQDVPVVMISADTSTDSLQQAFDAGAVDYITKPLRKIDVLVRVKSFLRVRQLTIELRKANDELQQLVNLDGLTHIANRRYFDIALHREWRHFRRSAPPLALLMIDIDYFKRFNDRYGHLAGDRCLRKIAKVLSDVVKRPRDLAARYGGEEFALILPETDRCGAVEIAKRAIEAVAALRIEHATSTTGSQYVSVSIGVAVATDDPHKGSKALIDESDQALYLAKQAGRNRFWVAGDPESNGDSSQYEETCG